jgi:hypothetical protein
VRADEKLTAFVLVRFDHISRFIVNENRSAMRGRILHVIQALE